MANFRIRTDGAVRAFIGFTRKLKKASQATTNWGSYMMGQRFYNDVGFEIKALGAYSHPKHNTPEHMTKNWQEYVKRQKVAQGKNKGQYTVWLQNPAGAGDTLPKIEWIIFGTPSHFQENHPTFSKRKHPGAKPQPIFERAKERFRNRGFKDCTKAMKTLLTSLMAGTGMTVQPFPFRQQQVRGLGGIYQRK
jgi:hypothetical protein